MEASTVEGSRAGPDLACDIVMKGGITSGVVYPGAVLALKDRYRFRSIGGTSAGGIAAAVVAAAEHNREHGGFAAVEALPAELASAPGGKPFMLQVFQPDPPARPLFRALVGFTRWGKPCAVLAAMGALWRPLVVALVVAALSIVLGARGDVDPAFAVAGVAAAFLLYLLGLAAEVVRGVRFIGRNDFGMCRLGPEVGTADKPALTDWLHALIQKAAGRAGGPPLTFADLWGAPAEPGPERDAAVLELSRNPRDRAVNLQMMTTDLTHGRPVRLPVPYQKRYKRLEECGRLLFEERELRRFFPADVVDHLVRVAPPFGRGDTLEHLAREAPDRTFLRFPIGPELPVVVATRMTLSYPVLIAAVPLWELDYRPDPPQLRRIVFSDGGITSNFPVHFFDALLPTRPTFGLHLTGFPPGAGPDPNDPCASVQAPPVVNDEAPEPAAVIDGIGGFVGAIVNALQNWRDNAQAALPGYRDRIVHIQLSDEEGGMNLAMPADVITKLNARGACAGQQLVELFAGEPGGGPETAERWNDHRFVRYRIAMTTIEGVLRGFDRAHAAPGDSITQPYPDRVAAGTIAPYPYTQDRVRFVLGTAAGYRALVAGWGAQTADDGVPRPPTSLRAVPPV